MPVSSSRTLNFIVSTKEGKMKWIRKKRLDIPLVTNLNIATLMKKIQKIQYRKQQIKYQNLNKFL